MTWLTWLRNLSKQTLSRPVISMKQRGRGRSARLVAERLEDRITPATWDGGGGNALWSNPANWEGDVLPSNEVVIIPAVGASANVIFDTTVLGTGITIASLTSDKPFVLSGDTLTVTGNLQMQNGRSFTLQGGTLASANVLAGTTITGTSSGGTLNAVTVNGTLDLTGISFANVAVTGGLTLGATGVVQLGNSGGTTFGMLSFDGSQTLGGSGSIVFGGHGGNALRAGPTAGAALTIGPNILVHGKSGTVGPANGSFWSGSGSVTFTNQGTINADVSGGTITLNGVNWSNTGVAPKGIQVAAGAAATLAGSWTNTGDISVAATGTLNLGNSGGTWSNSGAISATATATLNLGGTFANPTLAGTFTTAGTTVTPADGAVESTA